VPPPLNDVQKIVAALRFAANQRDATIRVVSDTEYQDDDRNPWKGLVNENPVGGSDPGEFSITYCSWGFDEKSGAGALAPHDGGSGRVRRGRTSQSLGTTCSSGRPW
jgi:hypothetical protein